MLLAIIGEEPTAEDQAAFDAVRDMCTMCDGAGEVHDYKWWQHPDTARSYCCPRCKGTGELPEGDYEDADEGDQW
jgi:DnaJ-class molecular chaperone